MNSWVMKMMLTMYFLSRWSIGVSNGRWAAVMLTHRELHVIAKRQAGTGTLESLLSPANRARSSSSTKP